MRRHDRMIDAVGYRSTAQRKGLLGGFGAVVYSGQEVAVQVDHREGSQIAVIT
jgi:hypothetical protein